MKERREIDGGQKGRLKKRGMNKLVMTAAVAAGLLVFSSMLFVGAANAQAKWAGVDETVVEKVAKEHGRETRPPLINTDQGDLLLFAFLLAGAVSGFAAGYYWRKLTERATGHEGES